MLILNFDSSCVCENNKLSKEGIISFREVAYPVGTSEEVITIRSNKDNFNHLLSMIDRV